MKYAVLAFSVLATLCACANGTSTLPRVSQPGSAAHSASSDARTMPAARDASRSGVTPHIVYPVRSLYEVVYARGYKAAAYTFNGKCSLTRGPNGIVTGCEVFGGSASPYYTKSSFYLHSKPNGDGCTLAVGHFHGQTYAGQPIPIAFYWLKNACYP